MLRCGKCSYEVFLSVKGDSDPGRLRLWVRLAIAETTRVCRAGCAWRPRPRLWAIARRWFPARHCSAGALWCSDVWVRAACLAQWERDAPLRASNDDVIMMILGCERFGWVAAENPDAAVRDHALANAQSLQAELHSRADSNRWWVLPRLALIDAEMTHLLGDHAAARAELESLARDVHAESQAIYSRVAVGGPQPGSRPPPIPARQQRY